MSPQKTNEPRRAGDEEPKKLRWWQIMFSVMAAAFGVQSAKNRERDFTSGGAAPYLIAGAIFTILFILSLVAVVKLVLSD